MDVRYTIENTPLGWSLLDGNQVVGTSKARIDAVLLGTTLAYAVRAVGGSATLLAEREDQVGPSELISL